MHITIFVYNAVLLSTSDMYHNTCSHFHENIMINVRPNEINRSICTCIYVHVQCLNMYSVCTCTYYVHVQTLYMYIHVCTCTVFVHVYTCIYVHVQCLYMYKHVCTCTVYIHVYMYMYSVCICNCTLHFTHRWPAEL